MNSVVDAVPPRSRVRSRPSASTASYAVLMRSAIASSWMWFSIITPLMMHASGLAMPLPAMSGRRAVHRLEDGRVVADVRARHDAQPADQAGAQVADQVAVEVLHQQHVEAGRVLHELHAAGVDDQLLVARCSGTPPRGCARAQSRNSPSVSFMMFALWKTVTFLRWRARGVAERVARDARAGHLGRDLEARHHARATISFSMPL